MTTLADRFSDPEDLAEAMMGQKVVRGIRAVATALANAGELVTFAPGEELMRQGGTDTDCYFLLAGGVDIQVNGATLHYGRGPGDLVGEIAAINTKLTRIATLTANSETVALKCTAAALKAAGKSESEVWRLLAIELSSRVEQRNQLIAVTNERPRIFMIAVESRIAVAKAIRLQLIEEAEVDLWSDEDLVPPGGYVLDTLHDKARSADFGVVLAHPDDLADARERLGEERWETVRFELGYLMSELTRHRTLLLVPNGGDGLAPRLFKGVTPMTYRLPDDDVPMHIAVTEAVEAVRRVIAERKVRSRLQR